MTPERPTIELRRLPALDGLRAVAVYLVVAFHAGLTSFDGGFIGVDVFFVLSGFLITRLLIVEYASAGRVDLLGFYARRVRRLLPAAWGAIVVTSAAYVLFSNPFERDLALDDARASTFYVANWHFIDNGQDYFAESISSSPFLHLWSLAVEEQFYLAWPLLALGLLALWRRSAIGVTVGVGAFAGLGAWWAWSVADGDLLRAYYGTDTRAYQLLTGAAIAFVLSRRDGGDRRPLAMPAAGALIAVGVVGLVVLATTGDFGPVERGLVTAAVTAAVVFAIGGRRGDVASPAERLLGCRPMVVLGNLSYGTYLWHWPLVILLERTLELGTGTRLVVVAAASTGLAHISQDLIERPIRRRSHGATRRADRTAVGIAVAGTLVVGLLVAPAIFEADVDQVRAVDRAGFVPPPVPVVIREPADPAPDIEGEPLPSTTTVPGDDPPSSAPPAPADTASPFASSPTLGAVPDDLGAVAIATAFGERDGCVNNVPAGLDECIVVEGSGTRVMLIGDSHASKLNIAFAEHAAANDLAYAAVTMNGCAWQRTLVYETALPVAEAKEACRDQRDVLYDRLAPEFAPDIVVAVSHGYTGVNYGVIPRPDAASTEGLAGLELVDRATRDAVADLAAAGAEVVVLDPIPNSPFNVAACLSGAALVEECQFIVESWPGPDALRYRELGDELDSLRTVDMTDLACSAFPVCPAVVDGIQVREDRDHLYGAYVLRLGPTLMARIGL